MHAMNDMLVNYASWKKLVAILLNRTFTIEDTMNMTFPFIQIQVPSRELGQDEGESTEFTQILSLLEKRLPKSCLVYNAVKIAPRFPQHSKVFYGNPNSTKDSIIGARSWIIVTHFTEDHGQNVMISAPLPPLGNWEHLLQLFSSCPTSVLHWEEPYWLINLDFEVARLMTEISVTLKGHSIEIHPDMLLYMDKEDHVMMQRLDQDLNEVSRTNPNVEIKALDPVHGSAFISSTWKLSRAEKTYLPVARLLKSNESGGVYLKDQAGPVSGLFLHGSGLLSMLHTYEKERGKGYAKMGIQFAARAMMSSGLYPASSVDAWNKPSLALHAKLGFRSAGLVQWIMWRPSKELQKLLDDEKNG